MESTSQENIKFLSVPSYSKKQENMYIALRELEGRLYSDEIVNNLPYVDRKFSFFRFFLKN